MEPLKLDQHYINITSLPEKEIIDLFKENNAKLIDNIGLYLVTTTDFVGQQFEPMGVALCSLSDCFYYDFNYYNETRKSKKEFFSQLFDFIIQNTNRIYCYDAVKEIKTLYSMFFTFIKLQSVKALCIIDGQKGSLEEALNFYCNCNTLHDKIVSYSTLFAQLPKKYTIKDIVNYVKKKESNNADLDLVVKQLKSTDKVDYKIQYYYGTDRGFFNGRNLGQYACQCAVATLKCLNEIQNKHNYSSDCYMVYLNNQYLQIILELSGIYVNVDNLYKQRNKLEAIIDNCNLYIAKTLLQCEVWQSELNPYKLPEINDSILLLLEYCGSAPFITSHKEELGLEVINNIGNKQDVWSKILKNKYLDFQIRYSSYFTNWSPIKKNKQALYDIGETLCSEIGLERLITDFQNLNSTTTNDTINALKKALEIDLKQKRINQYKEKLKNLCVNTSGNPVAEINEIKYSNQQIENLLSVCLPELNFLGNLLNTDNLTKEIILDKLQKTNEKISDNSTLLNKNLLDGDLPFALNHPIIQELLNCGNFSLQDVIDSKALICLKFLIVYRIRNSAVKILNTSNSAVLENSYTTQRVGSSVGFPVTQNFGDKKVKYYSNITANACVTNRWTSRDHSQFTADEDTRACLEFRSGDSFLLDSDILEPVKYVYSINGYNFRPTDFVKTKERGYIRVDELTDDDDFDKTWLENAIYFYRKRCKNVDWSLAYKKG